MKGRGRCGRESDSERHEIGGRFISRSPISVLCYLRSSLGSLRLTSSSFLLPLLPERMSKVSRNVVNREPNEAATEGERNLWMVDFIMDFMGFFCYFHNKIHNKSTYKIIKNNKCRNDPKNPKIKKINEKNWGFLGPSTLPLHIISLSSRFHSARRVSSLHSNCFQVYDVNGSVEWHEWGGNGKGTRNTRE